MFQRNPIEREVLSSRSVAVIGAGSVGSAIADMLTRAGIGSLILIDDDVLSEENLARHILSGKDLGRPKVEALRDRLVDINPALKVRAMPEKFKDISLDSIKTAPDLIVAAVDSYRCESAINQFSLKRAMPAVYVGCWGAATVGEIYYTIPGQTACYECFADFRKKVEIPTDPRKYTDPHFDDTKVPGQPGLWANILAISGIAFQVILALLSGKGPIIDEVGKRRNLLLVNFHYADLQPYAVTFGNVKRGCVVCDESVELTV